MRAQFTSLKALIDAVPAGPPGETGPQGPQGDLGPQGAQGVPGEVSGAALNEALGAAILGTSNTSNGVGLLALTVSDPPTQYEMQLLVNKLDELIAALRR